MTGAKVMDIISRLPDCAGQAADAVSAFTQVKLEDAPKLLKIPKSECPDLWIRLPRHKWPKSLESIEDPVVPLERNLYGHPLPGLSWERQFEKVLLESEWEKVPNWECLFVQRKQQLFLSVYVDDIKKKTGKKQNLAPVWMKLMKNVDLHEPTSFLDHVYWRWTQRECRPNEIVIQKYKKCLNHVFLLEQQKNFQDGWNLTQKTVASSFDVGGHAQICMERYRELGNKRTEQLYTVSSACLDDHQFKKEELESVGELSEVCSQIVLKCLYLARSSRPDILWSVTEWTEACDRRWARLISKIRHTRDYRQYCHVGNTAQHCRLGFISRLRLCWRSGRFDTHIWRSFVYFWFSHVLCPSVGCAKKQTSVSHSSTESEIISLECWFAHGRFTCSWSVGHCNRGVTLDERQRKPQCQQLTGNRGETENYSQT